MKIAYLLDSSSSINDNSELFSMPNVYYLPLNIIIDGYKYEDDELNKENQTSLFDKIKNAKSVCTAQPTFQKISDTLDQIIADGYDVVVCALAGSGLSNTQNLVYSIGLEKKLTVVELDSKAVGPLNQAAVNKFMHEVCQGRSLLEVQSKVQHMLDVSNTYALIDNMNYLKKGGRITTTNALFKSLMDVKQIIKCDKDCCGKIKCIANVRGVSKALDKMLEDALKDIIADEYHFCIAHYEAQDLANELKTKLIDLNLELNCSVISLSDTVGAHTGPHCVSLTTIRK